MSSDNRDMSGTPTGAVEDRAKQDASGAAERVQSDLSKATDRAAEDAQALKHEAQAKVGEASEQAKSFAADQKDYAATQITGIASAISKVADELDGEQATTARYARDLAHSLDRFGKQVEGKSVDDLMGEAQRFGRTQPLAFLGAAALAGFMASRFAGASAHRREQLAQQPGATQAPSDSAYGKAGAGGAATATPSAYGQSRDYRGGGNVSG
ncbi:nutrient deprivation-induced protein [uncultured Devosia sp.]|uniref:nutrient deprivation-induced protein n=1 Tax=uncultured Devosia sp. TaxID=211434 RepID=UPI002623E559|nr:nutrient deprivation-induced protein [uncultured Devosia sp.]